MKNIRILEDGNRLIVVLEGYEKSAVGALIEMLGTTASPLSHIKPHIGEAQFQLKGTEKEIPLGKAEQTQKPDTSIKKPAFVEQLEAEAQARKQTSGIKQPAQGITPEPARPAKTVQTEPKQQEAAQTAQESYIPVPDDQPGQGMDESVCAEASPMQTQAHTADAGIRARQKPAEFMNAFELRAYIRQADSGKLSALLRRKGRFPNTMHLLNADDRTIREYVKELLLPA